MDATSSGAISFSAADEIPDQRRYRIEYRSLNGVTVVSDEVVVHSFTQDEYGQACEPNGATLQLNLYELLRAINACVARLAPYEKLCNEIGLKLDGMNIKSAGEWIEFYFKPYFAKARYSRPAPKFALELVKVAFPKYHNVRIHAIPCRDDLRYFALFDGIDKSASVWERDVIFEIKCDNPHRGQTGEMENAERILRAIMAVETPAEDLR